MRPLTDDDPRAIGPYRIANRIGVGGMGTVYLGFGPDGTSAAVKVPAAGLAHGTDFRARFRQEVAAARRVRGSRVAAVLDADVDGDRPWMATEYVNGSSLSDAVQTHGRLKPPMLTSLATGLAEALTAIHSAGVVHRDLKPSNILLSWQGPKIIDFGIARPLDAARHTGTGTIVGTMVWMAPEQLRDEWAGTPADVFAWGACVAFAGTGRLPFRGELPEAVALKIIQGKPDLDGLPEEIEPLIRQALAKDPAARPTAGQLVSQLAVATGGTAVDTQLTAEPGTRPEQVVAGTGGTHYPDYHGYIDDGYADDGYADYPDHVDGPRRSSPIAPKAGWRGGVTGHSRVPLALVAVAFLLFVATAALAVAIVAGEYGRPAADAGTTPAAPAAPGEPDEQTPTPQSAPPETSGEPEPANAAFPDTSQSPVETASPAPSPTEPPAISELPSPTPPPSPDVSPSVPEPTAPSPVPTSNPGPSGGGGGGPGPG